MLTGIMIVILLVVITVIGTVLIGPMVMRIIVKRQKEILNDLR